MVRNSVKKFTAYMIYQYIGNVNTLQHIVILVFVQNIIDETKTFLEELGFPLECNESVSINYTFSYLFKLTNFSNISL